ncbi:hypothetical protein H9P43_004162 [Blastocladiella emersonii ATCC 22665]|nr:hypothetical protein H9P43_004162 [Blastocladiella emersonii ATCC 22665]
MASTTYGSSGSRFDFAGFQAQASSMWNSDRRSPLDAVFSTLPLTPAIKQHVAGVYGVLAGMMAVTATAVYFDFASRLPFLHGWVGVVALIGSFVAFMALAPTPQNYSLRHGMLLAIAALKGVMLTPLVEALDFVNPSIVPRAAVSALLIFASFSIAALYAKRRVAMYAFATIGAISFMSLAMAVSSLFGARFSVETDLVLGLVMFSAYVVADTQVMIHRAAMVDLADKNLDRHLQLSHAIELYTDLIQLFIRIAALMAKKEDDERSRRRDSDGNRRSSSRSANHRSR